MTANNPPAEIGLRTDPGRDPDKQINEDSSFHRETAHGLLAVVCDGMGGHAGGKEASELGTQTILEVVEAAPAATTPGAALKRAVEEANSRIWSMPTAEAGFRPGSTVVAILVHEEGAEVAHVGDSRLYLIHAGVIVQVTRDHSIVQEMVDRNLIRAEDASRHPDANKILRALGIANEVEVELRPEPIPYVAGDILILCSDGLSDLVEPAEILDIAGSHPPAQAAGQLVDLANARGGHDNITAMVMLMKTSAAPRQGVDRGRVAKTIPLTAHAMPEQMAGPTGTHLGGPAALAPTMPLVPAPHPSGPALHGQSYPMHPHGGMHSYSHSPPSVQRPRPASVVLGVVLAVVAVFIVAAGVVLTMRREHHSVKVVTDRPDAAAVVATGDDSGAPTEPNVVPAPTLSGEPTPHWRHRLDGGTPDPCGALRRAKDRDAGQDLIDRLTDKCKATGANP